MAPAFEVSKALGAGFLEKVYERNRLRDLTLRGVSAKTQAWFPVCYKAVDNYSQLERELELAYSFAEPYLLSRVACRRPGQAG